MKILGWAEPSRASMTRRIGQVEIDIDALIAGGDVVIEVPSASIMIAIDNAPNRVRKFVAYYEYESNRDSGGNVPVEVNVRAFQVGDTVEPEMHLIGHAWVGGSLIAVYGKAAR